MRCAIGSWQIANGVKQFAIKTFTSLLLCGKTDNIIKDPHWYVVQGSDTTMMPIAASLPGQILMKNEELKIKMF